MSIVFNEIEYQSGNIQKYLRIQSFTHFVISNIKYDYQRKKTLDSRI